MNWYNPYLIIPLVSWWIAQVIKFAISIWKGRPDFQLFYSSGGMPSAHSAVVCALALTSLIEAGYSSPIFGISAVLAGVVMYDALGVRRAVGEQATAINSLLEKAGISTIKTRYGHQPKEVWAGAALGVSTALIFTLNSWRGQVGFLTAAPSPPESWVYLGYFVLVGLGALLTPVWFKLAKIKRTPTSLRLRRFAGWTLSTQAGLGLLLVLAQLQTVEPINRRFFVLTLLAAFGIYKFYNWQGWLKNWRAAYQTELIARRNRPKKRR